MTAFFITVGNIRRSAATAAVVAGRTPAPPAHHGIDIPIDVDRRVPDIPTASV